MTTMAAMRARVRTRLEETTEAVWTDAELDECVTGALEAYSWRYPLEVIATVAVSEGVTSVAAPTGALAIQRVILADGCVVPRRGAPVRTTSDEELAWELFAGSLRFSRALAAQNLSIWHTATQTLDSLPASDEGLLVLGAVVQALEARAIQDAKRGQLSLAANDSVITQARTLYDQALTHRARRVRSGSVAPL